jgi:hypothetical protein
MSASQTRHRCSLARIVSWSLPEVDTFPVSAL